MVERRIEPSIVRRHTPFESIATFALVAALLYFGAGIIVPLVLAILLAFALTPLVTWLNRRLHLPDAVAVILAVVGALCLLLSLATLAGLQLARLAEDLPGYQQTVSTKLTGLQEQFGGELMERINGTISSLSAQVSDVTQVEAPAEGRPVPVAITNNVGPLGLLSSVLGSIVGPVATLAIVVIFLIFLLLGRADMLERFIRLVGSGDYAKTNLAMADASRRVGRYLLVQLAVNSTYGVLFGLGLWLIGVPSALLWGVLIVVFRYIPFVGALIIATVPFALAFAVDPTWNMLLLTLGLFLVLDLTTANVVEPRLYGSSTGVSPIAILISAMFWATLWGPIGLILATPMTVCLVVIGRHIPELRFLDTLLGSEPVLTPPEQLYQRLLKGDPIAATEILEEYTTEHSQADFIDEVALPALIMASEELTDRPAAFEQRRQMVESFNMMLEEFETSDVEDGPIILLIGGRTEVDEAAARLLAIQLSERGIPTRVLPPLAIKPQAIERLDLDDVGVVAMVFLGADIRSQARYVSRRLRRRSGDIKLVACAFGEPTDGETVERLHLDAIYRNHVDATKFLHRQWESDLGPVERVPLSPRLDPTKTLVQARLQKIAADFGVAVARVDLLGQVNVGNEAPSDELTRLAAHGNKPLFVTQEMNAALLAHDAFLQSNGILLYAGTPLKMPNGDRVGVLALLDYQSVTLSDADLERLERSAAGLVDLMLAEQVSLDLPQPMLVG
ncbi:AI-2E family transporter [Devosia sp. BK]|uniref:AI-2E family transporter n=1 Tax=Devosia sp. BK TaxID=2871706 RepID=UPI00293B01C8|nr:AI-2E family transporter [Devosia sp. BK]MDV3251445.1 AI-2E family transporter [Devosia sp. BK]